MEISFHKIGLFTCAGKIPAELKSRLQSFIHFASPERFFLSVDCTNRVKAITTDYYLGVVQINKVVLAHGYLLGQKVQFAIAATSATITQIIIPRFGQHKNLVANVEGLKIEGVIETNQPTLPISAPPPQLGPARQITRRPDFSFIPVDRPGQKRGFLIKKEIEYADWLIRQMTWHWGKIGALIPDFDYNLIIRLGAISLIRSNPARLDRFVAWGMLEDVDARALARRSAEVSSEKLTKMLVWFVADHFDADGLIVGNLKTSVKNLFPRQYLLYLTKLYSQPQITLHDAWYFANQNPTQPEQALRQALDEARRLTAKYKDQDVSEANALYFAIYYPTKSEPALTKALSETKRLAAKYKDQGVSEAEAWRFATYNFANPERALIKALRKTKILAMKYKNKGISEADVWYFVLHNPAKTEPALKKALSKAKILAEKYKDQGLTEAEAWYFAVYHPGKPEEAIDKAKAYSKILAVMYKDKGISETDIWYFAVRHPDSAEQALDKALADTEKLLAKYKGKGISKTDAWRFAVYHPKDSEQALINALDNAKVLYNRYKDNWVSLADARYFVIHHPTNSEQVLLKVLTEAEQLVEKYKDRKLKITVAWRLAFRNHTQAEQALIARFKV